MILRIAIAAVALVSFAKFTHTRVCEAAEREFRWAGDPEGDAPFVDCIVILTHLFFWSEQYRRTGRMSIVFLFDENPDVASAGSRRSGRRGAKCAGSRRSLELRASGAVGSRWQAVFGSSDCLE